MRKAERRGKGDDNFEVLGPRGVWLTIGRGFSAGDGGGWLGGWVMMGQTLRPIHRAKRILI